LDKQAKKKIMQSMQSTIRLERRNNIVGRRMGGNRRWEDDPGYSGPERRAGGERRSGISRCSRAYS
jgi:hypothetical protein